MSLLITDLEQLYQQTFGNKPYKVTDKDSPLNKVPQAEEVYTVRGSSATRGVNKQFTKNGSLIADTVLGVEIWLPTQLITQAGERLSLPYSAIRISGKKTIIKTPLMERRGTVKEIYGIDDYSISIRGFLIDKKDRFFPEDDILLLRKIYELNEPVQIDNALINIFLQDDDRVVIESIDLPEVEGGKKSMRSFSMQLESDSVFTLEVV